MVKFKHIVIMLIIELIPLYFFITNLLTYNNWKETVAIAPPLVAAELAPRLDAYYTRTLSWIIVSIVWMLIIAFVVNIYTKQKKDPLGLQD
jgi:hypothetical protein